MTQVSADPFDSAATATLRPRTFYGQCTITAWHCVLPVKGSGAGKEPFDPAKHSIDKRLTCVEIGITPLADTGLSFSMERQLLAESTEWVKIVWPSLQALGIKNPREINQRWVVVLPVETGRPFTGRDGLQKQSTTVKFLKIFASEVECRTAYFAERGTQAPVTAGSEAGPMPGMGPEPSGNGEKDAAMKFIEALAKSYSDKARLKDEIVKVPMLAKYLNTPEVLALISPF